MEASVSLEGREVLRLRIPETLEEEAEVLFLDAAYVKETEGTFVIYAKGGSAPAAGYNVIEAADGGVLCSAADCPDLVCVHTGTIHRETEMIACLPHRMSVQLIAAS